MILFSETINIDNRIHDEWLSWIKGEYVPAILSTGLFLDNKILRLLNEEDNGGTTYSFQFFLDSRAELDLFNALHATSIQAKHQTRYKNNFVVFRTVLEVVS